MERIYFDKQIFSYLFKGDNPKYINLLSLIKKQKDNFLFVYSHGHILDLKNDKTDIKYQELEFMGSIVNDNYLSYHALNKYTSCYLAKPIDVFKDESEEDVFSLTEIFNDWDFSFASEEQRKQLEEIKTVLTNQTIDIDFSQIPYLKEDEFSALASILPVHKSNMTYLEWAEHLLCITEKMEGDKSAYKDLRKLIDKNLNNGKFTLDYNNIDFNDDLKNSPIKKSFVEYVNNNLNPTGKQDISDYDFYINAYMTLDILGISKEPSKKVKYKNLMNDGYHSYYGAFCDYLISDDLGFIKKTKAMYSLLNIKTIVLHLDEFIPYFTSLIDSHQSSIEQFVDLLNNDIQTGTIISSKSSERTIINANNKYLGYFNTIEPITVENTDYIFLSHKKRNKSNFTFLREYEGIINKALSIFGEDYNKIGKFNWEIEIEEIINNKWEGRFWIFENFNILIERNNGTKDLGLQIRLKSQHR